MDIDFDLIPEYVLFKDLTSLDKMFGFVTIDTKYEPQNFKKEDRQKVFLNVLDYYRDNDFSDLMDEYIKLKGSKSYSNYQSVEMYNNFVFNHPMVVMLEMFIEQGLLTSDLKINSHVKKISLGEEVLNRSEAKKLQIEEGVIFTDGTLLKIESKEAHKIGALWLFLNGRKLEKAIRYTDDCIHPEPIFTSMNEYANIGKGEIRLTKQQSVALYNVHMAKSRSNVSFEHVLEMSTDLCISWDGNPEVRYHNVKTLECVLGEVIFNAKQELENLRCQGALNGALN